MPTTLSPLRLSLSVQVTRQTIFPNNRQLFSEKCITELYMKTKVDLSERLLRAERVAITTDAWTSCATDMFIIQYIIINSGWELESYVLQTRVFNESHTGKTYI